MGTRRTARLRLEPIGPQNAGELLRLHADPSIAEWWGTWTRVRAETVAAEFAAGWEAHGVSKWLAFDRVTGELVGRGGLSRAHVDGADRLEVGWAVIGRLWGNGYATEIGAESLSLAFEELGADEVVAFTEPHNDRSRAVMERLGMTYQRDIIHDGATFVLYRVRRPPGPTTAPRPTARTPDPMASPRAGKPAGAPRPTD
jgi:[ribosomal protein S5]-alanine N-acetyltransferase